MDDAVCEPECDLTAGGVVMTWYCCATMIRGSAGLRSSATKMPLVSCSCCASGTQSPF